MIIRYPAVSAAAFGTDMFVCRLDEFVLGMVVAAALCSEPSAATSRAMCAGWHGSRRDRLVGFDLQVRGIVPPLTRAVLGDVLDAGFCAIVLAALVPGTRLAAALSWRSLQVLGMMCYSVYIWHWPLLSWMMPDRAALLPRDFAAALVCSLLLMAALAAQ